MTMTDETWGQVREELLKAVGKNNFSAWIAPISFDRMDGRTAMFHVPDDVLRVLGVAELRRRDPPPPLRRVSARTGSSSMSIRPSR
jgi:hypothetical protein